MVRHAGFIDDRVRRVPRRAALAASVVAALLLASCAAIPPAAIEPTPQATAPEAVGTEEHQRIVAAYGGVYRDAELERTLARIVGRLVAASDDPSRSYAITILNASAINAFALPDGQLYVTRGLLVLANDSSEVAAVLAHEMAHVTADHAALRQDQILTAQIVGEVVRDVLQDDQSGQAQLVNSQQTLAGFSRQQELEADIIGIRTIGNAGYDPYAAARFLEAMSQYGAWRASVGIRQSERPEFLASHPNNPERINAAVQAARQFGALGIGEVDHDRYLAGVDGVVFGDDSRQGYVRGQSFYHADLAFAFSVPDGFAIENTREAVLATGPDGTALRFDAVTIPRGQSLADYIASGWVNGLDRQSIAAYPIGGLQAASADAAAQGWTFRITLIELAGRVYRFIFATDAPSPGFDQAAAAVAGTFRALSAEEAANLRPLTVSVVTVAPGDTTSSMAGRMGGVASPLELFLILNGLTASESLVPGSTVKIVVD